MPRMGGETASISGGGEMPARSAAEAVRAGWNECVRNVFSLTDQTADETADKTSEFERGRRFEAKNIAKAMSGLGPEHCEELQGFFTTHQGMTIAGDGAAMLGKLMREQHASRGGVYPDGNPNAGRNE